MATNAHHPAPEWVRDLDLDNRVTRVETQTRALSANFDEHRTEVRSQFGQIGGKLSDISSQLAGAGKPNWQALGVAIACMAVLVTMGIAFMAGIAGLSAAIFQGRIAVLEQTDHALSTKIDDHLKSGGHTQSQVELGVIRERLVRLAGDLEQLDDKLQTEIRAVSDETGQRLSVLERRVQVETVDRINLAMALLQQDRSKGNVILLPDLSTEPTRWK